MYMSSSSGNGSFPLGRHFYIIRPLTSFDHDSPDAPPDLNTFHSGIFIIRDKTKHVSG